MDVASVGDPAQGGQADDEDYQGAGSEEDIDEDTLDQEDHMAANDHEAKVTDSLPSPTLPPVGLHTGSPPPPHTHTLPSISSLVLTISHRRRPEYLVGFGICAANREGRCR